MCATFINRLPNNFKVRIQIEKDSFKFDIVDNSKVWHGVLSFENIKQYAETLGKPVHDYWKEIKLIMTTPGGVPNCCYTIDNGYFLCRKEIQNTNIKSIIVKIKLIEKECKESLNDMINTLLDQNMKLQSDLEKIALSHRELSVVNKEANEKLKKYSKLKNDLEQDLYGKFLVLLNSKKDVIRKLERIVEKNKELLENDSENTQSATSKQQETSTWNKHVENDFDTIDSQHSIDEIHYIAPKRTKFENKYKNSKDNLNTLEQPSTSTPLIRKDTSTKEHLDAQNLLADL